MPGPSLSSCEANDQNPIDHLVNKQTVGATDTVHQKGKEQERMVVTDWHNGHHFGQLKGGFKRESQL